ncbi:hypothetical protein HK405_007223, partial [Cladochytrium tenue]
MGAPPLVSSPTTAVSSSSSSSSSSPAASSLLLHDRDLLAAFLGPDPPPVTVHELVFRLRHAIAADPRNRDRVRALIRRHCLLRAGGLVLKPHLMEAPPTPAELDAIADVLHDALAEDKLLTWALANISDAAGTGAYAQRRRGLLLDYVTATASALPLPPPASNHPAVPVPSPSDEIRIYHTDGFSSVAIWTGPEAKLLNFSSVLGGGLWRWAYKYPLSVFQRLDHYHNMVTKLRNEFVRDQRALFLRVFGTRNGSRRSGLAKGLMLPALAIADAHGIPCYTEVTDPGVVAALERWGFEVVEMVDLSDDGSVVVRAMA